MKFLTHWQKCSVNAIANALIEYEAQLSAGEKVEINKCKRWLSKAYPFDSRENHPYKVWLSEVKLITDFLSINIELRHYKMWREGYKKPRKLNSYNEKRKTSNDPNQLSLF